MCYRLSKIRKIVTLISLSARRRVMWLLDSCRLHTLPMDSTSRSAYIGVATGQLRVSKTAFLHNRRRHHQQCSVGFSNHLDHNWTITPKPLPFSFALYTPQQKKLDLKLFFFNPAPPGLFPNPRPPGGGSDPTPPLLSREPIAVSNPARQRSKALYEFFPKHA